MPCAASAPSAGFAAPELRQLCLTDFARGPRGHGAAVVSLSSLRPWLVRGFVAAGLSASIDLWLLPLAFLVLGPVFVGIAWFVRRLAVEPSP